MGKKTVISVVALIVLAIALVVSGVLGLKNAIYVVAGMVLAVFVYALVSIDKTLNKHPQLALMDGSEFVDYRKVELEMAAKGLAEPPQSPRIPDPKHPLRQLPPPEEEE